MDAENADTYLVQAIRNGDQRAWRNLIERYQGRLLAFARTRTPSFADAEDVVQETFVGFAASLSNYDTARSLETYLFTIARYKLYDLMRQKKLPTVVTSPDADQEWDKILPGDDETPSRAAVAAEASAQQRTLLTDVLRRLIHDLRDRDAFDDLQVIELVFFAGKRNLDVAELLEIDQKAVAGIKFRAIGKLKKYLGEADPEVLACLDEQCAEVTVSAVWRSHRLTCLKRSTLGSYLLGVIEEPWLSYTQFHLDVVGCEMCVANLQDLEQEEDYSMQADTEQLFKSSVGFLKTS